MRKSLIVELVLLNSVLAFSGCTKVCSQADPKRDPKAEERTTWDDDEVPVQQNTCRGSRTGYHGGGHVIYWHGGGGGRASRPGTGTVGRGGFGSTGHAVS